MKKCVPLILLCLVTMILAGCEGKGATATNEDLADGRTAFYGYRKGELLYCIVTDGEWGSQGYQVSGSLFSGTQWEGTIKQKSDGMDLVYSTKGKKLDFGGTEHDLEKGRIFEVTTATSPTTVVQLTLSLEAYLDGINKTAP